MGSFGGGACELSLAIFSDAIEIGRAIFVICNDLCGNNHS
jgi:hypothetical protein